MWHKKLKTSMMCRLHKRIRRFIIFFIVFNEHRTTILNSAGYVGSIVIVILNVADRAVYVRTIVDEMDLKLFIFCVVLHFKGGLSLKYPDIDSMQQFYTISTDQEQTDRETSAYTEKVEFKERISKSKVPIRSDKWWYYLDLAMIKNIHVEGIVYRTFFFLL